MDLLSIAKEMYSLVTSENQLDRRKWADFVLNHPDGNIFQTPQMYDVFANTDGFTPILISVVSENEIKGILLAVIQRELKGVAGKLSKRAVIRGGPLVEGANEKVMDLLLKGYLDKTKEKVIYSQIRNWTNTSILEPTFLKNGFKFIDHLNLLVDLRQPEDIIWKEINNGKRRSIRKAYKYGVTITLENPKVNLNDSFSILEEVYHRIKLPYPGIDFFENWQNFFNDEAQFLVFTAKFEEKVVAFRYVLAYKNVLYISYAGGLIEYSKKFANDLINWEMFLWGKENGFTVFDFAGAGSPHVPYGVRMNKMRFGGKTYNLGRYELIHKPILFSLAKRAFFLWKKFKKSKVNCL